MSIIQQNMLKTPLLSKTVENLIILPELYMYVFF